MKPEHPSVLEFSGAYQNPKQLTNLETCCEEDSTARDELFVWREVTPDVIWRRSVRSSWDSWGQVVTL